MANVICWPTQLTNMPPGVSVFFFQPFFSFYRLEFCLMKKKLTTHDVVLVTCHLTRFTFSEKLHWSTPIVETRASFFYTRWSENTLCLRHKPRRRYEMKKTRKKNNKKNRMPLKNQSDFQCRMVEVNDKTGWVSLSPPSLPTWKHRQRGECSRKKIRTKNWQHSDASPLLHPLCLDDSLIHFLPNNKGCCYDISSSLLVSLHTILASSSSIWMTNTMLSWFSI